MVVVGVELTSLNILGSTLNKKNVPNALEKCFEAHFKTFSKIPAIQEALSNPLKEITNQLTNRSEEFRIENIIPTKD